MFSAQMDSEQVDGIQRLKWFVLVSVGSAFELRVIES